MNKHRIVAVLLFLLAVPLSSSLVSAQRQAGSRVADSYPGKPIRFLVPTGPGTGADLVARAFSSPLTESWKVPVIIDNRAGASGNIATELVAKSSPDGYTLLFGLQSMLAVAPSVYRDLPYDSQKDFVPVSLLVSLPIMLVAHPSVPAGTVKDLVTYLKENPRLNYVSAGNGSSGHLSAELFKLMTGVDIVHIPYKIATQAIIDLIAGRAQLMFFTAPVLYPHVKAGRLKAIAITSARRSSAMPEVPTIAESGVPGYEMDVWIGVLAPAGTPKEIITKLHREFIRILQSRETRDNFAAQGVEPIGSTPEQFTTYLRSEIGRYAKLVKQAGVKLD